MTAINAKIGLSGSGAEEIQKSERKDAPFFTKPRIVTDKKTSIAITAVTAM